RQKLADVVARAGAAAAPMVAPIPFARDVGSEKDVGHLGLEAELVAGIVGVGAAIGAGEAVEQGVGPARVHLVGERVGGREARIVAADDLALGGAQALAIAAADQAAPPLHHLHRTPPHPPAPSLTLL